MDHISRKDVLIIIEEWNAEGRNKEEPHIIGEFDLEVRKEAGGQFFEFCDANTLICCKYMLQTTEPITIHVDITRWLIPEIKPTM